MRNQSLHTTYDSTSRKKSSTGQTCTCITTAHNDRLRKIHSAGQKPRLFFYPEDMKARPQNQSQKAVEDWRSDKNGEEMQPGPSTHDVKQNNEEQVKESFLAILSKEWQQLVQKVDKLQVTQNEALKELTTVKPASAEKQKQAKQQRPYCIHHKNNFHATDD
uniref:Uncharacterized protein n=1 Tax=Romanomermis culicivorax TaxID=13658 RepID=A0A915KXV8_ROMCU